MRIVRYPAIVFIAVCLASAEPLLAQDAESARAFLNSIFKLYANHGKGIHQNRVGMCGLSTRYVHSSLLALIDADVKAVGTDIPIACNADIVCGCQEWEGIWIHKMDLTLETPQCANAVVTFSVYAPKNRTKDDLRTYKYTLIPENGQWRIYDVAYITPAETPDTLRKAIQKDIVYYTHPSQDQAPENKTH
jgi:hypothetical protein